MAKRPKYDMANYNGGIASHPEPEAQGYLLLNGARWELHFKRNKQYVYGGLIRYRLEASPDDAKGCRVNVVDGNDSSVSAAFELPGTRAEQFAAELQAHMRAVEARIHQEKAVSAGQWWLNAEVFKGFGFLQKFSMSETDYLGGWSGHPKSHKKDILEFGQPGIAYKAFRTLFLIPWEQVADIEVEGADQAASRVTATRLVGMGVFALAAKKKSKSAVVIVRLKSGEEACFHTEKFLAPEVRAKLSPVISQLHKAAAQTQTRPAAQPVQPESQPTPSPEPEGQPNAGLFVADELIKLAQLRDVGVITEEQFTAQRDRLMT
jgi:hypothetical protein